VADSIIDLEMATNTLLTNAQAAQGLIPNLTPGRRCALCEAEMFQQCLLQPWAYDPLTDSASTHPILSIHGHEPDLNDRHAPPSTTYESL